MDIPPFEFGPLAKQGLFWPAQRLLFVADLHLGKEASFCREGIAVPRGASETTLQRVHDMLAETSASRLAILGDLFHAKSSLANDVRSLFASFLASIPNVAVTLVRGNHDLATGKLPSEWPIEVTDAPWIVDDLELAHFPSSPQAPRSLTIAGHLHPAIRLRGNAAHGNKLACFHYDKAMRCLTLPAIGAFTGTALIRPSRDDRVWITAEDEVMELDVRAIA